MVSFPSGSISGTINDSVYIDCCGSSINLSQQSHININMSAEIIEKPK